MLLNYSSNQNDLVDKTNKIILQPGPSGSSPAVLDGNACDKGGGLLQLPIDVATTWTVYARALAKPNASMDITTCGVDDTGAVICSGTPLNLKRSKGQPVATDVTKQLLYITLDDGSQIPVFASDYYLYFWDIDNQGLRNAQVRFYPE